MQLIDFDPNEATNLLESMRGTAACAKNLLVMTERIQQADTNQEFIDHVQYFRAKVLSRLWREQSHHEDKLRPALLECMTRHASLKVDLVTLYNSSAYICRVIANSMEQAASSPSSAYRQVASVHAAQFKLNVESLQRMLDPEVDPDGRITQRFNAARIPRETMEREELVLAAPGILPAICSKINDIQQARVEEAELHLYAALSGQAGLSRTEDILQSVATTMEFMTASLQGWLEEGGWKMVVVELNGERGFCL